MIIKHCLNTSETILTFLRLGQIKKKEIKRCNFYVVNLIVNSV